MCGLVGVAGNLEFKDEMFMRRLLLLDYFRGTDSTGLAAVNTDRDIAVAKMATHPLNLFDSKKFQTVLNGPKSVAFIGHNRAATIGKINDLSAHPYTQGDVVGAHNGTLSVSNWTLLKKELGYDTLTDSEAIIHCIDEFGIEATVEMLEEGHTSQTGAWALTWYDKSSDAIHFLRNKHRPLWVCYNKKMTKVAWASEYEFLSAAVQMTKDWDLYVNDKGNAFFEVKSDRLYTFELNDLIDGMKPEDIEKACGEELKGKAPKYSVVGQSHTYQPPFSGAATTTSTTGGGKTSRTGCDEKVVDISAYKSHPFTPALSEEEFFSLTQNGCSFCGASINPDDIGTTIYKEDEVVLCSNCSPRVRPHICQTVYVSPSAFQTAVASQK